MDKDYLIKMYEELEGVDTSLSKHLLDFAEYLVKEYSFRPSKVLRKEPTKGIETLEEALVIIKRLSSEVVFQEEARQHLQDVVNGKRQRQGTGFQLI